MAEEMSWDYEQVSDLVQTLTTIQKEPENVEDYLNKKLKKVPPIIKDYISEKYEIEKLKTKANTIKDGLKDYTEWVNLTNENAKAAYVAAIEAAEEARKRLEAETISTTPTTQPTVTPATIPSSQAHGGGPSASYTPLEATNVSGEQSIIQESNIASNSPKAIIGSVSPTTKKELEPGKVNPTGTKHNGSVSRVLNGSTGIITGAGILGTGLAIGGGTLMTRKPKFYTFTPQDWHNLGNEIRGIALKDLREAGFNNEDLITFQNSSFKIRTSELDEYVNKLQRSISEAKEIATEIKKLYGFSVTTGRNTVNNYYLFLIMLIDGKSQNDKYNIYDILNRYTFDPDKMNLVYNGIEMSDYIYETKNVDVAGTPIKK